MSKDHEQYSRFALFAGQTYYPVGAFGDLVAKYLRVDQCKELALGRAISGLETGDSEDWQQIVDMDDFSVYLEGETVRVPAGNDGGIIVSIEWSAPE